MGFLLKDLTDVQLKMQNNIWKKGEEGKKKKKRHGCENCLLLFVSLSSKQFPPPVSQKHSASKTFVCPKLKRTHYKTKLYNYLL